MSVRTNGATLIVVTSGLEYHTLATWGLAIGNNNCIGDPVLEEKYLDVAGRTALLDYTEALAGRPIYKSRPIDIVLGGLRNPEDWDSVISEFRNLINGRRIKVIFDNDPSYYWIGRCHITDFDRAQRLGSFHLQIPNAEPHKYDLASSMEDIPWDSVDFEHTYFGYLGTLTITDSYALTIPAGTMPVAPTITVNSITSTSMTVRYSLNNTTYTLATGENYFPEILVNGDSAATLTFTGSGEVEVDYRGGSL